MPRSIHFPCIYFIQAGDGGRIKIGYTTSLDARKIAIEKECGKPTTILGLLPGSRTKERLIHGLFCDSWIEGEWFRPATVLLDFIKQHTSRDRFALIGRLDAGDYWLAVVDCRVQRERCRAGLKKWTRETKRLYREARKRHGAAIGDFGLCDPHGPPKSKPEEEYIRWWYGLNTLAKTMDDHEGIEVMKALADKHPEIREPTLRCFRNMSTALSEIIETMKAAEADRTEREAKEADA